MTIVDQRRVQEKLDVFWMLCFLFATVDRHIFCSSWSRGISGKSWACKKNCITCSKSVFSKIFSRIVGVWYWKTAILSIALQICQHEDIWPIREWFQKLVSWKGSVKLKACLQALLPFPPPLSTAGGFFSLLLTPKCFVVLKAYNKMVSLHSYPTEEVLDENVCRCWVRS